MAASARHSLSGGHQDQEKARARSIATCNNILWGWFTSHDQVLPTLAKINAFIHLVVLVLVSPNASFWPPDGSSTPGAASNTIAAMSLSHREEPRATGTSSERGLLTLSGVLLLVGFLVNAIQRRLLHPTGAEDDHEAIFTAYAASEAWVATHLAEFVLVLMALAGLLVLCGALRPETPRRAASR